MVDLKNFMWENCVIEYAMMGKKDVSRPYDMNVIMINIMIFLF